MNSTVFGRNTLYVSIRYIWFMVFFRSEASLLTFCLEDQSIGVRGVFNSPSIIVLGSMCDLMSQRAYFMKSSCTYVWGINVAGLLLLPVKYALLCLF